MAKKKEESKIVLERTYNVPLRSEFLKISRYRRAKKAVTALKEYVVKHMKSKEVKIGKHVNHLIWKHGIKNPPHHVKVICKKNSEGLVNVEMVDPPKEKVVEKKVSHVQRSKKGAIEEQLEKLQKPREEKQEKAKQVEKEELKELKENPVEEEEKVVEKKIEKQDHPQSAPKGEQEMSGPQNK
ncbi:50S ribosomal protein L31e [Nanoarchaeota archaeon]